MSFLNFNSGTSVVQPQTVEEDDFPRAIASRDLAMPFRDGAAPLRPAAGLSGFGPQSVGALPDRNGFQPTSPFSQVLPNLQAQGTGPTGNSQAGYGLGFDPRLLMLMSLFGGMR